MIYFPHPLSSDEEGLLAIGGDLKLERLMLAYRFGIFPWFNHPPILWWFTFPRCIIYPDKIKISKTMRPLIYKRRPWKITLNKDFGYVIDQCARIERKDQYGTWITGGMNKAYKELHENGYAHSLEIWSGNEIIGGLYGVTMGKIFYGESMFSKVPNTSKYALIHLANYLYSLGCMLIDCQQDTPHMKSMGAILLSKEQFWKKIKINLMQTEMDINQTSFLQWLDSEYQ